MKKEHLLFRTFEYLFLVLITLSLTHCSVPSLESSTPTTIDKTTEVFTCSQSAEVSVSTGYVYYQITGSTASQLRAQMNQRGRKDEFGNRWDAYTDWYVYWSYSYEKNDDTCATGNVEVDIEVTFSFPKWEIPTDAPQDLIDNWNAYLSALQEHEDGHREIAVAAGCEILQELNSSPVNTSCVDLDKEVDGIAEHVLEVYRQQESDYDRITKHGLTQGVLFP